MSHLDIPARDRSLLKRIWWILVIRDSFGSALFGRPVRINGGNCDVEITSTDDFIHDYPNNMFQDPDQEMRSQYFTQVAELAVNLRDITADRFTNNSIASEREPIRTAAEERLREWRATLPPSLDWDLVAASHNPFVAAISMLHDTNLIFVDIQKARPTNHAAYLERQNLQLDEPRVKAATLSHAAQEAAERIINLATALNTKDTLTSIPHEALTAIFAAEVVSYTRVNDTDPNVAKMFRAQVQCCQLLLCSLRDYWDPSSWVMQLFNGLLTKDRLNDTNRQYSLVNVQDLMTVDFLMNDWENVFADLYGVSDVAQE